MVSSAVYSPEGLKQDEYDVFRQAIALGWLFFDVDRALTGGEMLPDKQVKGNAEIKNETMTQIAVWLLTDPSKRSKLLISGYDPYGFSPQEY